MQTTDNFRKHTSKNPLQKFLINNFYKSLLSAVRNLKIDSVLDVGCGEGFALQKLYQSRIGKRLEGIDFQKEAIELGRKIHPHLNLETGNIYNLSFKDNSFDLVMATEVLEHLEEPRKGLKELIRVSKKYLLLSVPNEPFFMMANFLRGKNWSRFGNDPEHIKHWTSRGFQEFIIHNSELRILKVKHPFPWILLLVEKH